MSRPISASCSVASALMAIAICFTTTGCGNLTSTVSGVVKLDGEVLKCDHNRRGTVVFRPVAGGASATGLIDASGRYSVRTGSSTGVKPGDYVVGVRVLEIIPAEDGLSAPSGEPITPVLYSNPMTSGLLTTLTSGVNTFDIELDSSAGPMQLPPPAVPVDATEEEPAEETVAEGAPDDKPAADSGEESVDAEENSDSNDQSANTERVEE